MPAPLRFEQFLTSPLRTTAEMNNDISEKPTYSAEEVEAQRHENSHDGGEKTTYDKTGAIDAENIEHQMTVTEAVKAYPAASWWAFVMSCTIVSSPLN